MVGIEAENVKGSGVATAIERERDARKINGLKEFGRGR